MDEWAKTLVGTLAGFTAGLFAEPAKFWIGRQMRVRQLRSMLYEDLASARAMVKAQSQLRFEPGGPHKASWPNLDVYDYFYNSERPLFYRLRETERSAIIFVYAHIRRGAENTSLEADQHYVDAALQAFETCIADGTTAGERRVVWSPEQVEQSSEKLVGLRLWGVLV